MHESNVNFPYTNGNLTSSSQWHYECEILYAGFFQSTKVDSINLETWADDWIFNHNSEVICSVPLSFTTQVLHFLQVFCRRTVICIAEPLGALEFYYCWYCELFDFLSCTTKYSRKFQILSSCALVCTPCLAYFFGCTILCTAKCFVVLSCYWTFFLNDSVISCLQFTFHCLF